MAVNLFDLYVDMESAWRTGIPKSLRGMKPKELIDVFRLAAAENGVSQGAAASALAQSQWGMSKITAKLVREKWMTVTRSTENHKQKLMSVTPKARLAMDILEEKLAAAISPIIPTRASRKAEREAAAARRLYGTHTFFNPPLEAEET
jgi:DNA-binding MarR family transcriptional regulator